MKLSLIPANGWKLQQQILQEINKCGWQKEECGRVCGCLPPALLLMMALFTSPDVPSTRLPHATEANIHGLLQQSPLPSGICVWQCDP